MLTKPQHFVDFDDFEKRGKDAVQILRDLIVARPTEFDTLKRMFYRAIRSYGLTWKQAEALHHARVARDLGQTESVYVASRMGINRHSAWKLLSRAEQSVSIETLINNPKMETFTNNLGIYSDTRTKIDITAATVDKVTGGMLVDCVVCGKQCRGKHCVCYACSKAYGSTKEERPHWLNEAVKMAKAEARLEAKAKIFRETYGINQDVSDLI